MMPGDYSTDVDFVRYYEFAKRILLMGEMPHVAAKNVGWDAASGKRRMRTQTYKLARGEILTEFRSQLDGFALDIRAMMEEAAFTGVGKLSRAVKQKGADMGDVKEITRDFLDRLGARVPQRSEAKLEVSLTPESAALVAKANADMAKLAAQVVPGAIEAEWSWATEKPALGIEQAKELVGTALAPEAPPLPDESE